MKLLADTKSHFSIGESMLTPEEIVEHAAAAGYQAVALCDTMTISGMPDFTKACDKHDLKPVVGVRLRIVPTIEKMDKQYSVFPKLYILTNEGFEIVTRLLSLANDTDHFYRVPRLTWLDVLDALKDAAGHVAYSTGTLYSASRDKDVSALTKQISALLTRSLTFCEIVPGESAVWDRQAQVGYDTASEHGLQIMLSRTVIFQKPDGMNTLSLMTSITNNHKRKYGNDYEPQLNDYKVISPGELLSHAVKQTVRLKSWTPGTDFTQLRAYEDNWSALCEAVKFKWQKLDVSLPKMAPDENAELWRLAKEGFKQRLTSTVFGYKPSDLTVYVARLKYEMDVLTDMGFAGYFLLTHEIVKWSKDNGILVGPGRGSIGGSLVSYVLGISDVDPIRFGLIFERFINPERLDLPDADLDFMSTRRHEVFEHISDHYGAENVAGISNYSTLGSKAAVQDLSRILEVSEGMAVTKFIPSEGGTAISLERAYDEVMEVTKFADSNPAVWNTARDIEGRIRTLSQHAAGVVVAGEPLVKRAALEHRKGGLCVNWDKRVVEDMGLVKMDILGLSTLDLIAIAVEQIKQRHGFDLDLLTVPLDDPDILQFFGEGRTIGVFQFESGGMRNLLKSIYRGSKTITFEDISAATALYRPGPMESGLMDDFVNIKGGFASEMYEHPSMQPALEETYSVIVYQEQVMRIAQDLCGFTMAQADHLRKAIGKKDKKKMEEQGDAFISGAVANGMDESTATVLWDKIVKFAGYAFNKSHSVEYSLISYQCMYLKVKYPVEFFAAALTILDEDKKPGLIKDAERLGIHVSPPDVNYSSNQFEILTDKRLVAPFSIMKGLSDRGAVEILKAREDGPFKTMQDFEDRIPKRVVNKTVRAKLDLVGAFARIEPQIPAEDPRRRVDQLELIPSIMVGGAVVDREVHRDKDTIKELGEALNSFRATSEHCEDAVFVTPKMGKRAKIMVVLDGPGYHDEQAGQFTKGGFEVVEEALEAAGLDVNDAYWTAFSKVPKRKGEQLYDPSILHAFKPLLDKELELLNPQVILCLGSNAARHFDPTIKGGIADIAGKVTYRKSDEAVKNDRNIVIGITPGMIFFDPTKQVLLNEAFQIVAEMVG